MGHNKQILDCYKALNIPRFSEMIVIRKAYRRLSLKWHPDRNNHPNAMSNMQIVNRCYEILQKDKQGYDSMIRRLINPKPVVTTVYTFNAGTSSTANTYNTSNVSGFTWRV